jgi:hypothetical protein
LRAAVVVGLLAVGGALAVPASARAADWCGSIGTAERQGVFAGNQLRVWYAIPSDGSDNSGSYAATISRVVDTIEDWWRSQDSERAPRFARAPFACGPQVDLRLLRLPAGAASLRAIEGRFRAIAVAALISDPDPALTHVVFYDGPLDTDEICGQGGGDGISPGVAIYYTAACAGVPAETVVAHELLHALGALPRGAAHPCPDSPGHPCDSESDLLYPFASTDPITSLLLDYGHDDYYGHSGTWPDLQDSPWLKLVNRQVPLTLASTGTGVVRFRTPGGVCVTVPCTLQYDQGANATVVAQAGPGKRLRRWLGPCAGQVDQCSVKAEAAATITAEFVDAIFRLAVTISGKGTVTIAGTAPCVTTCTRSQASFAPAKLAARPAKGWRFVRWGGACKGTRATCTVPMSGPTRATAVFKKKK